LKKVIVIGLDGLEPTIVDQLLQAGELPNLERLRARGGYSRVATTSPAQTPVAWSSFATGRNPGAHGIFDFIRRNPKNYLPDLALNRYESRGAFLPPRAVNLRRAQPVWELIGNAGIDSTVVRCPVSYPPDPVRGKMLSGMGVPDLRGGLGTGTVFTTDADAKPRESENLVRVEVGPGGNVETAVIGPRHPKTGADLKFDIKISIDEPQRSITIRSAGEPREITLHEGEWSDWLRVKFKLGLLQTVAGHLRFYLIRTGPGFELYASPVNFDVDAPLFPISHPADYAGDLARVVGLYHTTGMVEDHTALNNERIGEAAFLDQCETAWEEREAMMMSELERHDRGLFYCLFDTPDRVQHLFWRFREPDHPANRGRAPQPEFERVIEDQYRRGDRIVGQALELADDETLVIALSDHGFGSFRRGVNLNTLLHEHGFLSLKPGVKPGHDAGDLLKEVAWGETKAYALGLSGIYLNLQGREGQGSARPEDAEAIKAAIAKALTGLKDPVTGEVAIRNVRTRESAFSGPLVDEAPDLLVDFAPGYRISFGSSLGGIPEELIEDNTKKWSGDHIIDPSLIPGVLFMNRPFRGEDARLTDMAPTILDYLGVPKGQEMEGSSLLS
jgi:predicted AlkP superfamily phosphohydrolase/phosphomutase